MSKAFASATYSRQQTCPILVTKNCFLYWDQQTFRKIREISADFVSPIVVSTNFVSVLYWSQKTQNNKIIDICCKKIQTSCNIGMNSEFFHFLHMLHKVVGNSSFFIYRLRLWELLLVNIFHHFKADCCAKFLLQILHLKAWKEHVLFGMSS